MTSFTEDTVELSSQESRSSASSGLSLSQASSSSSSAMEPSQATLPDPPRLDVRVVSDHPHLAGTRAGKSQPSFPESLHPAITRALPDPTHLVTRAAKMIPPAIPVLPILKSSQSLTQQRRSSTRSIKRKKFDDELVESSLIKIDRGRVRPFGLGGIATAGTQTDQKLTERGDNMMPLTSEAIVPPPPPTDTVSIATSIPTTSTPVSSGGKNFSTPAPPAPAEKKKVTPAPTERRKSSKTSSKRARRPKPAAAASLKDLGRWKPQDDLMLIAAVQQTNDLSVVHMGVKFSCKFTLKEIQERWYALLYDPTISKVAISAIKQLHPDLSAAAQGKTLMSQGEEELIGTLAHNSQPAIDVFQDLLDKNAHVFHPSRTARALHNHWLLMKQYHLLPDQSVQPMPKGDHILHFSDAEDLVEDENLREPKNEVVDQELSVADRRHKREIRQLEQELPKWQVLVDHVTGISPPDFDSQTLAVLRGRLVRYLMRSREITLGRATKENQIDVDLSLEGPAWKISRRQGAIKLRNNGEFFIANEGKRPIYVDGMPVLGGNKQKLNNNSVVEISCLRFIFLINQDLISVIQTDAQKPT